MNELISNTYSSYESGGGYTTPDKATSDNIKTESYQPASGTVSLSIITTKGFSYEDNRYIFPIPDSETTRNPKLAERQLIIHN
ncbi:MAG: hypothetical protein LBL58_18670 [Tannerellaceae bacterium]|nr:hypothetical protein [Tannerellaceae bacterium]